MARITRRQETLLLCSIFLSSIVGLVLVITLVVLPSLPHQSRVDLVLHRHAGVMEINTYDRPQYSSSEAAAACWLSARFLVDGNGMSTIAGVSFTSSVDLPYGHASNGTATGCEPALAFIDRHPGGSFLNLFIAADDHNAVYFNESTGAATTDWSRTYNPHVDPPTLEVYKRVGSGITVGGGFLLALCIVFFLVPSGLFWLRCYEDRNPQSYAEATAEEQHIKEREGLAFTPLSDSPNDDEEADRRHGARRTGGGGSAGSARETSRSQIQLEMEEKNQFDHSTTSRLRDEEIMDEPF